MLSAIFSYIYKSIKKKSKISQPYSREGDPLPHWIVAFDIETENKCLECKDWEWQNVSIQSIAKLKSTLPDLARAAFSQGKKFEFHSKHPIPESLKVWLEQNHIFFVEG